MQPRAPFYLLRFDHIKTSALASELKVRVEFIVKLSFSHSQVFVFRVVTLETTLG